MKWLSQIFAKLLVLPIRFYQLQEHAQQGIILALLRALRASAQEGPQQGAAAREPDAVLHYVGVEFGRRALEDLDNLVLYLLDGLVYAGADFLVGDGRLNGVRSSHVAARNPEGLGLLFGR